MAGEIINPEREPTTFVLLNSLVVKIFSIYEFIPIDLDCFHPQAENQLFSADTN